MRKILILLAHPKYEHSDVNHDLIEAVKNLEMVTVRDLYELYPDFNIDVQLEQEVLFEHEVVIWHHPIYWYSCPPLLKQWIDLVLEFGWAYGSGGIFLKDKLGVRFRWPPWKKNPNRIPDRIRREVMLGE